MDCMNNCGTELTDRQRTYCSDNCRKQAERAKKAVKDLEVPNCEGTSKYYQYCKSRAYAL